MQIGETLFPCACCTVVSLQVWYIAGILVIDDHEVDLKSFGIPLSDTYEITEFSL